MQRRDRGLDRVRPRRRPRERARQERETLVDRGAVPEPPVLVLEEDEVAGRVRSRGAARVREEHEREEPARLAFLGQKLDGEPREPDRLGREIRRTSASPAVAA